MDLQNIPVFAALIRRLDWLSERQRVIASNIANVDTPGYRPRDLPPPDFRSLLGASRAGLPMAATHANHLARAVAPGATPGSAAEPRGDDVSPAGNAVVIEQQMMKVAETQVEHQTVANLYRKHIGMLKLALGRPQS